MAEKQTQGHRATGAGLRPPDSLARVGLAPLALALALAAPSAHAAGSISIEFNAGYNLVVDSNVCSPSTYAPEIATNGVGFCNYGDAKLTDVVAYVGDVSTGTPGVYPTRDSSTAAADICATSTCLCRPSSKAAVSPARPEPMTKGLRF